MSDKYYKIVFGYNEADYIPITADELHKAFYIAIKGGGASFKNGYFNNRGNDVMRIVPDWHTLRGWNKSHKMDEFDFADIKQFEESYNKTLSSGKLLAEFITKNQRKDLLQKAAPEAFKEIKHLIATPHSKQISEETKKLADKFNASLGA